MWGRMSGRKLTFSCWFTKRRNFGWSIMEGNHSYDGEPQSGMLPPAAEYSHAEGGCSVTGGYVYRGGAARVEWSLYLRRLLLGVRWGIDPLQWSVASRSCLKRVCLSHPLVRTSQVKSDLASDNGNVYHLTKI